MGLTPGTRLGPYEILSALGAGGMGEVYRARDTKLGSDVASKVIPDTFALDPDRLARFKPGSLPLRRVQLVFKPETAAGGLSQWGPAETERARMTWPVDGDVATQPRRNDASWWNAPASRS